MPREGLKQRDDEKSKSMAASTPAWRPPLGAVQRTIDSMEECERVSNLLHQHYEGRTSSAALVVAYVEGIVDFVTPAAFADHVEGNRPQDVTKRVKVLRQAGDDPIAILDAELPERHGVVRPICERLPEPKKLFLEGPSREAQLADIVQGDVFTLDADF